MVTHIEKALHYARQVRAGEVPACKWTRLAADRHLDDLEREPGP
jgi:phage terminase large subunit-like protein